MSAPARTLPIAEPPLDHAPITGWRSTVGAYISLTKPRIIELLLVTTVPAMIVAHDGIPSLWLILATLIGGLLGGTLIGWALDRLLGTWPVLFIALMVLGTASGFWSIIKMSNDRAKKDR